MILSAREIRLAVRRGIIGLDPFPEEGRRWASTTVDLTLDAEIRPWEPFQSVGDVAPPFDPASQGFNANALIARYTRPVDCTRGFLLEPGKLVLGWTAEKIKLPQQHRIGARVEGKSSLARIGLGVHVTAPTIHPGFGEDPERPRYPGSPIRLEIWNAGTFVIKLTKGMAICQLVFEEVHGTPEEAPGEGYLGQFRLQGPGSQTGRRRRRRQGG
jgi:dCTP deaminase